MEMKIKRSIMRHKNKIQSEKMDERSCFVCCFDYELISRKPYMLKCCPKTLCSECLHSIIDKNEKCPNCRKTLTQTSMNEFSLNVNIEEALKFEQDGNVLCQQCTMNSKEKAIKICLSCGPICNQCYSSHLRMKVLKEHEISSIPAEKWSQKLDETLKASSRCEQHTNRMTESFCKTCQKVVCEDCIAESHSTCKLSSIDNEFEETKIRLERELDDMNVQNIAGKCVDTMNYQKLEVENIDREIKALETHCREMLISNFEAVITAFQEKKKKLDEDHHGREKKLTNMTQIHTNLRNYVKEVGSIQNKRGVLQQYPLVQRQIDDLCKEIKEVDDIKPIDYLAWIKDIFNELQLAANKNAVVDYALEVAENCDGFPSILNILRKYRHLNTEKAQLDESLEERVWYVENNNEDMFPRYKYHLNLVQKIVDHEERLDPEIITSDLSKCRQCPIIVLGSITEPYRKLLDPLTFKQLEETDPSITETHMIAVFLADTFDAEYKTLSLSEGNHLKTCSWCIMITTNRAAESHQRLLSTYGVSKFSIISPDANMVWDHITSAIELPLIEYLEEKRKRPDIPRFQEDVETVIRRLEKFSSFPMIQSKYKSNEIPDKIKDVLERFEQNIVRYGFCFDQFRVVVMNENHERVEEALSGTKLDNFPEIIVIRQSDFKEDLEPFCGELQAQGRKLYISSESDKDSHGTLGCLAKLNDTQTVGVSCRHVCEQDKIVYIENGQNERIALGKCLYTSSGAMSLHSDFAIVDVNSELLGYFPRKKLTDHAGVPTNAMVFSGDTMSLKDEIVHKLGASSEWTQGKVVCTEITERNQGIMMVRGMNGQVFGIRGDSGSIVFREMFNAREQKLEVVALLTSGEYEQRDITDKESKEEQPHTLIICSLFKTALEQLRKNNTHIQSFEFFSD